MTTQSRDLFNSKQTKSVIVKKKKKEKYAHEHSTRNWRCANLSPKQNKFWKVSWEVILPIHIFTVEVFTNEFVYKVIFNSLILSGKVWKTVVCCVHIRKVYLKAQVGVNKSHYSFPPNRAVAATSVTSRGDFAFEMHNVSKRSLWKPHGGANFWDCSYSFSELEGFLRHLWKFFCCRSFMEDEEALPYSMQSSVDENIQDTGANPSPALETDCMMRGEASAEIVDEMTNSSSIHWPGNIQAKQEQTNDDGW